MIVAGIGCRKHVSAVQIDAAIALALQRAGLAADALGLVAAPAAKGSEAGIAEAATARGLRLALVSQGDLEAAGPRTATQSTRAMATLGVPSVAEAAALAVAGPTARLLLPRIAVGPATCALARSDAP